MNTNRNTIPLLGSALVLALLLAHGAAALSTQGLVVWLNFENSTNDTSSNSNNLGNVTGIPTYGTGANGQEWTNPGATVYANNLTLSNVNATGDHTLAFWFKKTANAGGGVGGIVTVGDDNGTNGGNFVYELSGNITWNAGNHEYRYDALPNGAREHFVFVWNATNNSLIAYRNCTAMTLIGGTQGASGISFSQAKMQIGRWFSQPTFAMNGSVDSMQFFNRALTLADCQELFNNGAGLSNPLQPVMTALNCTSCNPPNGDTVSPYLGSDTTPTFNFTTDVNANCRIAASDWNFTTMGVTRNCTGGENTTSHKCTLTVPDALPPEMGNIYISCRQTGGGVENITSTSGALAMVGVAGSPGIAIDYGIHQSSVWPGATVYSSQQVYLRNLSGSTKLATVDRVVVYGNQRWLFNYANTTSLGLFNLTPIVYVLEMGNLTYLQVETTVASFINTTKT